ncbi:hypothetical protein MTO96_035273, partial [Rhipicephalus appendiculatus]
MAPTLAPLTTAPPATTLAPPTPPPAPTLAPPTTAPPAPTLAPPTTAPPTPTLAPPTTAPPTPTQAPSITSTTRLSTATTPVVPTTVTTTKVPLQPGSLLCTIGQGFDKTTYTFPPDGLCTIITFDSLYREGASLAPPYAKDFEYFLETAKKAKESEFGIAIHNSIIANATALTQFVSDPSTKKYLDKLWDDYRVYHYALVRHLHAYKGYHSVYVATVAKALETVSALMSDKKGAQSRPSYTILYFWVPSSGAVFHMVQRLAKERSLDVFVFMGYFRRWNINFVQCLMLPTTYLPSALTNATTSPTYMDNLGSAFTYLPAHSDKWPTRIQRAVAVGLNGRWYTPCAAGPTVDNRPANYSLGHRCGYICEKFKVTTDNQITSIAKACMQPSYNSSFYMDTTFNALVAFDVQEGVTFTYDSASNLRSK